MRDRDIRNALRAAMLKEHATDPLTRIIDEFCIAKGDVRVDIAVLNGVFTGIEIKSEYDTLTRLPKQADMYGEIFDYAHLVCAEKHLEGAKKILPSWWTISVVREPGKRGVIVPEWSGTQNPEPNIVSTVSLLWRDELIYIMKKNGLAKGHMGKSKEYICDHLASSIEFTELRNLVRETIKRRDGWRFGETQRSNDVKRQPVAKSSGYLSPLFPIDNR